VFHKDFTFHYLAHPEANAPGEILISYRDAGLEKGFWEETGLCDGLMSRCLRRQLEPGASCSDRPIDRWTSPLPQRRIEAIEHQTAGVSRSHREQVPGAWINAELRSLQRLTIP
jgi:hypothetical protein